MDGEDNDKQTQVAHAWASRLSGASALVGFLWFSISKYDGTLSAVGDAAVRAIVLAVIVYVVGFVLSMVILTSFDAAKEHQNPLAQGAVFALVCALGVGFTDFALFQGKFVVSPLVTLLLDGNFDDSFWGCREHWIDTEEVSYCGR